MAETTALIRPYREVHVTVAKANTRAIGFYRRLGFRPLELTEPGETTVTYLGRGL